MDRPQSSVPSPCVGVCQIHRDTGYCLGCWRTMKEIAGWARLDDPERRLVLEALRSRQAEAGVDRRRVTRRRARKEAAAEG